MTNSDRQWSWRQRRKAEGLTTHPNRKPRTAEQKRTERKQYKERNPDKVRENKRAYKHAHARYRLPFSGCDGGGGWHG